jgi:hypothetical protein
MLVYHEHRHLLARVEPLPKICMPLVLCAWVQIDLMEHDMRNVLELQGDTYAGSARRALECIETISRF